jgi:hypothetical protein
MSNNFTFRTAGGRITCLQCNAKSKRTQQQCAHLPQRERASAVFMAAHQLAPRQSKAGSVAQRLKLFTAMKRAKRETNGLRVCVDYVL